MTSLGNFTLDGFPIFSNRILNLISSPTYALHNRAYYGTGIIQAMILSSMKTIDNFGFRSWSNLNKVVIENTLINIGSYLFDKCKSFQNLSIECKTILNECALDLAITEIDNIQARAFQVCSIGKLFFSVGNIQIGSYSFSENVLLEKIEFIGVPFFSILCIS
jgi:hypothetical protein